MNLADLVQSRFTFGARFQDPTPVTTANLAAWSKAQLAAPPTDAPAVVTRLNKVQQSVTVNAANGTSTTVTLALTDLYKTSADLVAVMQSDTSANHALTRRPPDEVAAARWIRAAFSPWQVFEVMVDFWHNHFSVDAYQQEPISLYWPAYDQLIRANALGNFRALLGATAKSAAMMYFLNQDQSVKAHPNENFAREVMELHTLGSARYLGETTPPGAAGTGYSDQDVMEAARALTGWTIGDGHKLAANGSKPLTGEFLFEPSQHDIGAKTIFGQSFPAGIGQAEGERFLDMLAAHPGTALTIATKLYTRFVQDTPPANDTLIQSMANVFHQNAAYPNQIALVLQTLMNSTEFAMSAGQKVKTPFEFVISAIRATGAEVNPKGFLDSALGTMGQPLFHWPAPNGSPDVGPAWTGTNDMIRRWSIADELMNASTGILLDGPASLFAAIAPSALNSAVAATKVSQSMLGVSASSNSYNALLAYAASREVLGGSGVLTNPTKLDAGLRRIAGAVAATPEFQTR